MATLNNGNSFSLTTTNAEVDLDTAGNRAQLVFINYSEGPARVHITPNNGLVVEMEAEYGFSHHDDFVLERGFVLEGGEATRVIVDVVTPDSTDTNNTLTIVAAPVHARPLAQIDVALQADVEASALN